MAATFFQRLRDWWDDLRVTVAFLTRLPIGADHHGELRLQARSLRVYPLVGGVIGLCGAGAYVAATALGSPSLVAALSAVLVTVLLTGALHEDGLADMADACGAGGDRAYRLSILRDSRIGTYGTLALILSVGFRAAALSSFSGSWVIGLAMIAAHSLSRGLLAPVLLFMSPARADGLAAGLGRPSAAQAAASVLIAVGLCLMTLGVWQAFIVLLVASVVVAMVARLAVARFGGYTGDVLGAMQQTAETTILLTIAAMVSA